jgi:hypothetical protein
MEPLSLASRQDPGDATVLVHGVAGGHLSAPVGIGTGASAHSHAKAALGGALANTASAQAQLFEDYFSRARSIDLLTANNPAFGDFYALPGSRAAKIRAGGPVLDKTNQALGYLEELFPDSIGEACFIDQAGLENARMVRGVRATLKDLSPDESGNPFFAPTFALRQGEVYQARPYESPDTREWVISNSTLLPSRDGSKRAIVHFEVTIESFRKVAASPSRSGRCWAALMTTDINPSSGPAPQAD